LSVEPNRPFLDRLRLRAKSDEVVALESAIEQNQASIEALEALIDDVEAQSECNDAKISGESCDSSFAKFTSMFTGAKISEISKSITNTIDDLITVLVSMILTTIIFPLAFLYMAVQIFKGLSKVLLKNLEQRRHLAKTIEKTDVRTQI
jgi:hypothetical protein